MAIAYLGSEVVQGPTTLTIPEGTTAILCAQTNTTDSSGSPPTLGGLTFTHGAGNGTGSWYADSFYLLDISGRASDVFTPAGVYEHALVYVSAFNPALLNASAHYFSGGTYTFPQGIPDNGGSVALVAARGNADIPDPASGTTELLDTGTTFAGYAVGAAGENVAPGFVSNSQFFSACATVSLYDDTPGVSATRIGMELGVRSGAVIAFSGTPEAGSGFPMRGFQLAVREGWRVGLSAQRQVSLVGGDIETPEMTVGGNEGDVLVQHLLEPPTWEAVSALPLSKWREPVRMDTDGDGVYDAWLFTDEGDIVMIEKVAD